MLSVSKPIRADYIHEDRQSNLSDDITYTFPDHARLKGHVSQMSGQLEARVQEGGE